MCKGSTGVNFRCNSGLIGMYSEGSREVRKFLHRRVYLGFRDILALIEGVVYCIQCSSAAWAGGLFRYLQARPGH